MGKKLFVGNLPFSASESALTTLFSEAGQVDSCKIITDRDTGKSKGFCFIEMGTEEAAATAISKFNSHELEGRALTVNEARPQERREGGGGGYRGGNGGGGGRRSGNGGGGSRW